MLSKEGGKFDMEEYIKFLKKQIKYHKIIGICCGIIIPVQILNIIVCVINLLHT
jgi:hypothetical protein